MKKTLVLALLVAFALVGVAAFADTMAGPVATFAIGAYNGIGVVSTSTTTMVQAYDYSWVGFGGYDINFRYNSADGNVGLHARLQMSPMVSFVPTALPTSATSTGTLTGIQGGQSLALFDEMNVWGKFFGGMFTVRAGIGDDYTIATMVWNDWGNTDGKLGIYFDVTPVAGLDIGFFQPIPFAATASSLFLTPAGGQNSIVGAAYALPNVANIVVGASLATTPTYYGGVKITAIKNLGLNVEAEYSGSDFFALENVSYTMDALTVGSYIGEGYDGTNLQWGLEPSVSYKVSANLTANVLVNVYSSTNAWSGGPALTWMSPIDAGAYSGLALSTMGEGFGANVTWAASGGTITVGDYYATQAGAGNVVYVNYDVSL